MPENVCSEWVPETEIAFYLRSPKWWDEHPASKRIGNIGYFCAEYGVCGALPIYSGGLGILAGDHLKTASDLGLPLSGVGLLYHEGYFQQSIDKIGNQKESHVRFDPKSVPLILEDARVSVEFPGRMVHARIWRLDVGRTPLYLLDTDVPENRPKDRKITYRLYQGGDVMRIQQLMVLGIGGHRALVALGRRPDVIHMNEGHAGFAAVERVHHLIAESGLSREAALAKVRETSVFTTHTPVAAGFDRFPRELFDQYLSAYAKEINLSLDQLFELGRGGKGSKPEERRLFNMAALAMKHSGKINGVSQLHAAVSRKLLKNLGGFGKIADDEVPIRGVTNGVHLATWTSPEMVVVLDRELGPRWKRDRGALEETFAPIANIPDERLWRAHCDAKRRLVEKIRHAFATGLEKRRAGKKAIAAARTALEPDALTIGFARRFATYKRASLLFSDPKRLGRILDSADRPVQILFSGKAHPADEGGKALISAVNQAVAEAGLGSKVLFLEDYGIEVARMLVGGVDLWLNNPQRPREASGTSGMKVILNGGLNLSILDGWWAEGFSEEVGWSIGAGEDWSKARDKAEARAIYDRLENEIVPLFYERGPDGVPEGWMQKVKASMTRLSWRFSSDRMLREYVDRYYA